MPLDETQDRAHHSLVSWTETKAQSLLLQEQSTLPSSGKSAHCGPNSQVRTLAVIISHLSLQPRQGRGSAFHTSKQGDSKKQSREAGKGQEGTSERLFSFSGVKDFPSRVPQFSLNCYEFP